VAARENGWSPGFENLVRIPKMTQQERESLFLKSRLPARYHWQWKIKQILDPNNTADKGYDVLPKSSE
jgi:hypothetical protein